jgi:hypothetical protein
MTADHSGASAAQLWSIMPAALILDPSDSIAWQPGLGVRRHLRLCACPTCGFHKSGSFLGPVAYRGVIDPEVLCDCAFAHGCHLRCFSATRRANLNRNWPCYRGIVTVRDFPSAFPTIPRALSPSPLRLVDLGIS